MESLHRYKNASQQDLSKHGRRAALKNASVNNIAEVYRSCPTGRPLRFRRDRHRCCVAHRSARGAGDRMRRGGRVRTRPRRRHSTWARKRTARPMAMRRATMMVKMLERKPVSATTTKHPQQRQSKWPDARAELMHLVQPCCPCPRTHHSQTSRREVAANALLSLGIARQRRRAERVAIENATEVAKARTRMQTQKRKQKQRHRQRQELE